MAGSTAVTVVARNADLSADAEVIFNPAGRGGAARAMLPELTQRFGAIGIQIHETRSPGDEERLAHDAIARKVTTLIVVGGDGTCSNVANAILRERSTCRLGVVPAGTGNDFAKTLGVRNWSATAIIELMLQGTSTPIDVGFVDRRYFINSCGFGFGASVLEATRSVKFLQGDALYIYAALRQLLSYRGFPITIDGSADEAARELLMVTVSNGRFLGGAFHIAPEASLLDGALDVCVVREATVLQRVRLFASAFRGTHARLSSVRTFRAQEISLAFPFPPAIELDGELRQARSADLTIECIPRALNVIAADGAKL